MILFDLGLFTNAGIGLKGLNITLLGEAHGDENPEGMTLL